MMAARPVGRLPHVMLDFAGLDATVARDACWRHQANEKPGGRIGRVTAWPDRDAVHSHQTGGTPPRLEIKHQRGDEASRRR
jgi:hypothetical protein